MRRDRIAVAGVGIIGLLTARRLQELGYSPMLISDSLPRSASSAAAAGIMLPTFPFHPESNEFRRRLRWMYSSLEFLQMYRSGRYMDYMDHWELFQDGLVEKQVPMEWLLRELGSTASSVRTLDQPMLGFQQYASMRIPYFDTVSLLDALYADLIRNGVTHVLCRLDADAVRELPVDVLFNCLGIGASHVFGDRELLPVFGQAIRYPPIRERFAIGMGDFFVLSAHYSFYVGSPFVFGEERIGPKRQHYECLRRFAEVTLKEIARPLGISYDHRLLEGATEAVSGIRPFRSSGARIELEPMGDLVVVHNYGHGAHGWAAGWGAAIDAVQLWQASYERNC